ncbi:SO2930 family diheme c-type cytochrome [Shewanella sp. UCD-KL12]|uniref:SO2930 family diheme c-type cytochrome n=1 Tax=Shewanella sp. UCD-KL12 TaxID=1917163 RepID=UPI00097080FD|nr:SO2930 family diheme c-type cytochrome [Shewanella sp. UCD-KL12]
MRNLFLLLLVTLLTACGGSDDNSQQEVAQPPVTPTPPSAISLCDQSTSSVNWEALMSEDCDNLASYGLFIDPTTPTSDAVEPGLHYELSSQLFTNYAAKYRFLFIPDGGQITFNLTDTFEFPTGTVLTKTFSMPYDTQIKDAENQVLIETRLLIKREAGWTTLPYQWQDGEAKLAQAGADIPHTLNHQGQVETFNYHVPSRVECKLCHQLNRNGSSNISPIGLKAHLLNHDINYRGETINQLTLWQRLNILTGLPNLQEIAHAPSLFDSQSNLTQRVKGYLDINCAHCHRAEGFASISGLRLGFHINHTSYQYGVCKQPPGWDGGPKGLSYDIVPGNGEHSILLYRQELNEPKDRMPPLGRSLIHTEAVELIKHWIDSLPPSLGSCQ